MTRKIFTALAIITALTSLCIITGTVPAEAAKEAKRDKRFITYDNGTVLEIRTKLMWAAQDNGDSIAWRDAKSYCQNYRGGGYSDWRLPTSAELAELYGSGAHKGVISLTGTSNEWASETNESEAASFDFINGRRMWLDQSYGYRVLPVRNAK